MGPLLGLGIGFLTDLVSKHGETLVTEGVKAVTGIDLTKKEPTAEDKRLIMDAELKLMELDFKKLELSLEDKKEDNRHVEFQIGTTVEDIQHARGAQHLSVVQTDIAHKVYNQSIWVIPLLLLTNAGLVVYADKLGMDTTAIVAIGNLIGIALSNNYRERQSILEWLFGSSANKKDYNTK